MDGTSPPKLPGDMVQLAWLRWLGLAWRLRRPGVVWLTAALVASWLAQNSAGWWLGEHADTQWLLGLGHIPYHVLRGQWWRLVTPVWAHTDILHLGVNALLLWLVGRPIEAAYGPARLLLIWFGSALFAGIAMLSNPQLQVTVGASGAVYGLVAALVALGLKLAPRLGPRMRWLMIGVPGLCLLTLLLLGGQHTDRVAHLGGAVGGLTMGVVLRPQFLPLGLAGRRRASPGWLRGLAWAGVGLQFLAIALANLHSVQGVLLPTLPALQFQFDDLRVRYPADTRRGTFHVASGRCDGDLTDGAWALRSGRMPCWPLPLSGALVVAKRRQLFTMDAGDYAALRKSAQTGRWVERQTGVLVSALGREHAAVVFADPALLSAYRASLAELATPAGEAWVPAPGAVTPAEASTATAAPGS
ncbi:MAG: rhomboid family intramembrane serine protease [Deltaproteobacteria bacterium]|nr:rhomboid family intramembrane serine protease [Deltaproteobacteria bacterium]